MSQGPVSLSLLQFLELNRLRLQKKIFAWIYLVRILGGYKGCTLSRREPGGHLRGTKDVPLEAKLTEPSKTGLGSLHSVISLKIAAPSISMKHSDEAMY